MTRHTSGACRSASPTALLLVAGLAFMPWAARAQSADEIVAANVAATGGEEAIARIESFTSTGRVTVESPFFGKLEGTLEAVRVPGRGYFESVELGPISQQKGWDGEQSWEQGPAGFRILQGYEHSALEMQSFPATFVALRQLEPAGLRIERVGDADVNGRPHFVLGVSSDGAPRSTMYLDQETGLLSRSAVTMSVPNVGEVPVVVDLGDYQAFGGVMIPTSMTIAVEGISTTNVMLDSTVVNTTIDESIFTAPAARVPSE